MEYVKDRTEGFDDYYPCRKKVVDCNLIHVYQWLILFIFLYNLSKSQSKINIIKFLIKGGKDLNLTAPCCNKIYLLVKSASVRRSHVETNFSFFEINSAYALYTDVISPIVLYTRIAPCSAVLISTGSIHIIEWSTTARPRIRHTIIK
jgi:hypothetical protein